MKWSPKRVMALAPPPPSPPKPRSGEIPVHWITLPTETTETEAIEAYCRTHRIGAGDWVFLQTFLGPEADADILARGGNLPDTPAWNAACAEALLSGIGPAARKIECPPEVQAILRAARPPSRRATPRASRRPAPSRR